MLELELLVVQMQELHCCWSCRSKLLVRHRSYRCATSDASALPALELRCGMSTPFFTHIDELKALLILIYHGCLPGTPVGAAGRWSCCWCWSGRCCWSRCCWCVRTAFCCDFNDYITNVSYCSFRN